MTYSRPASTAGGHRQPQQTLAGACCGAVFGILLLVGATALLWMNEGVAVRTARSLDEAQSSLYAGALVNAPDGALVHATGVLTTPGTLEDERYGVVSDGMNLKRRVEVYLWRETQHTQTRQVRGADGQLVDEKTTSYKYDAEWATQAIDSSRFHDGSFDNPSWGKAIEVAASRAGVPFMAASWVQPLVRLQGLELAHQLRSQAESDAALAPKSLALPEGSQAFLLHGR